MVIKSAEFLFLCNLFSTSRLLCTTVKTFSDDDTRQAGISLERSILHIASLLAEDGAKQFFFRRGVALALRRNLADHDVAGDDARTDADNTVLVQVLRGVFRHVGDIVCQRLHTTFRLADFQAELFDMD